MELSTHICKPSHDKDFSTDKKQCQVIVLWHTDLPHLHYNFISIHFDGFSS